VSHDQTKAETVSLLLEFGLKEYGARSFLAPTQIPHWDGQKIREISEVPRTRVYDAVGVGDTGIVEVRHSSPQRFHVTNIEEANPLGLIGITFRCSSPG